MSKESFFAAIKIDNFKITEMDRGKMYEFDNMTYYLPYYEYSKKCIRRLIFETDFFSFTEELKKINNFYNQTIILNPYKMNNNLHTVLNDYDEFIKCNLNIKNNDNIKYYDIIKNDNIKIKIKPDTIINNYNVSDKYQKVETLTFKNDFCKNLNRALYIKNMKVDKQIKIFIAPLTWINKKNNNSGSCLELIAMEIKFKNARITSVLNSTMEINLDDITI